jgi:hypothetical protein
MGVWRLIMNWWHARLRRIDMEILWPTLRRKAPDLDHAKAGFAIHAFHDPAWLALGEDDLIAFIDRLA